MKKDSLNQAEFQYYRYKQGNILTELYLKERTNPKRALIFCYGMPSHPFDRFPFGLESYLNSGCVLVYPHYEGTFGSSGVFRVDNASNSVIRSLECLLENPYDVFTGELIPINVERPILVGGSFGGSVALVTAARCNLVNDVIAVAAPVDYKKHGRSKEKEYDLSKLKKELVDAYHNEWRIDFSVWPSFVNGNLDINPIDYTEVLAKKNTFLIHGQNDLSVSPRKSISFHEIVRIGKGNHRLLIIPDLGHLGCYCIGDEVLFNHIKDWLN